jgi:hypothetical protein
MDDNCIVVWATFITAVATFLGVGFSVWAILSEKRISRLQKSVEILLKYNKDFDDNEMRLARKRAALAIKTARSNKTKEGMEEADDVLDFFETIAMLVRRKAITDFYVWHSFFHWIHRYCLLSEDYVTSIRRKRGERARWKDLVWLYPRLMKIEKGEGCLSDADLKLSPQDLDEFIEDELKLG